MLNNYDSAVAKNFNRKISQVKQLKFIYQEIGLRMIAKFDYIKLNPRLILDIGSGLGVDAELLKQRFSGAYILQLDNAINFLKEQQAIKSGIFAKLFNKNTNLICASANALPLKNSSVDLVWSNLVLPYITDLESFFQQVFGVMAVNGCFLCSGLGVDSLRQLRELGLNTYNFPDMHLIGDLLLKLGFSNPVTDVDYIHLEYDTINQLLSDIRAVGVGSLLDSQYLGRHNYNGLFSDNIPKTNNKIKLTLEVFYAQAWKDKEVNHLADGASIIQFDYLNKKRKG
jgi:malonyl-CoA O-methyltransferase